MVRVAMNPVSVLLFLCVCEGFRYVSSGVLQNASLSSTNGTLFANSTSAPNGTDSAILSHSMNVSGGVSQNASSSSTNGTLFANSTSAPNGTDSAILSHSMNVSGGVSQNASSSSTNGTLFANWTSSPNGTNSANLSHSTNVSSGVSQNTSTPSTNGTLYPNWTSSSPNGTNLANLSPSMNVSSGVSQNTSTPSSNGTLYANWTSSSPNGTNSTNLSHAQNASTPSTNGTLFANWTSAPNGANSTNLTLSMNGTLIGSKVQNNATQTVNQSQHGQQSQNGAEQVSGYSSESGDCDFDSDTCIWRNVDGDDFEWVRHRGPTRSASTGPSADHSGKGFYMYIETSFPRKFGELARLAAGPFSGTKCMRFFYCMNGKTVSDLQVFMRKNGSRVDIFLWGQYYDQGKDWHSGNITVGGESYEVIFVGRRGKGYSSDIAIDDVTFENGPCPGANVSALDEDKNDQNQERVGEPGSCSFDNDNCDWINLPFGDQFDWERHYGRTGTLGTGPEEDHSGRDKHYIFAEASDPQSAGDTAMLLSPRLCGQLCMQFYYHMYGDGIGALKVFKREGINTDDLLWSRTGQQRNNWTEALVDLGGGCYQLVIQALIGRSYRGDIALDDLLFTKGSCCEFRKRFFDGGNVGNCTFDEGMCSWRNSEKDDFDWTFMENETASYGTGPSAGYNGSGQYMYTESSEPRKIGDIATLVSGDLEGVQCMRFKYHMYGETCGSLRIHLDGNGLVRTLMWEKIGNQGNVWHEGLVTFPCQSAAYHVEITAEVAGWSGDIALDNMEFISGACPMGLHLPNVSTTTLPTTTGPLVFEGNCTFPRHFCAWRNDISDDFDWKLQSGETISQETGPSSDADGNDVYIYIEASNAVFGKTARLISGQMTGSHCLRFKFYMLGAGTGSLAVEQKETGSRVWKSKWKRKGNHGADWLDGVVSLSGNRYQVSIIGTRGATYEGDISVDAVSIVPGSCEPNAMKEFGPKVSSLCSFNTGICDWLNERTADKFDWTLHSGPTVSRSTGPPSGRGGFGKYLYIETSSPRLYGDNAILKRKGSGAEQCLHFYYHMHGRSVGSLNVYQQLTRSQPRRLWSRRGDRGNVWRRALVNIPAADSYWILIEGIRGTRHTGDIAIDDVGLTEGNCFTHART